MLPLPTPAELVPVVDHHAWPFTQTIGGRRTHVRLRAWPTIDGGHLVIATDLLLGGGLKAMAAVDLYWAVIQEFGPTATVIRHFPAGLPTTADSDVFEVVSLNERGATRSARCTKEVLTLFGPSVLGYPGEALSGPTGPAVPRQSEQLARLLTASLRLHRDVLHRVEEPDLDSLSQMSLSRETLIHLAHFIANISLDAHGTSSGAKREKKLSKIADVLHEQAQALWPLCDELEFEEPNRTQ
ncbi:hypothetical protein [Streptomyces sp. x-45]|uniref:hypothetical protein n=1 Tax=Streptomyces sp. x-45 TaxID=2789281 RepID=UPI00397F87C6